MNHQSALSLMNLLFQTHTLFIQEKNSSHVFQELMSEHEGEMKPCTCLFPLKNILDKFVITVVIVILHIFLLVCVTY